MKIGTDNRLLLALLLSWWLSIRQGVEFHAASQNEEVERLKDVDNIFQAISQELKEQGVFYEFEQSGLASQALAFYTTLMDKWIWPCKFV